MTRGSRGFLWRSLAGGAVLLGAAAPPRIARAQGGRDDARRSEPQAPLWEPGNRTTSAVEPRVETDDEPMDPGDDGAYGRFEGDVDLGFHAGAELDETGPSALAGLTAHYYWMAGVSVSYLDALGREDAIQGRLLSLGVDVRPAFVPRWAEDLQHGSRFSDLLLDSISLGLGAFWASPPNGAFGDRRGFEASAGFGLPLFASARGLWLRARGVLRWPDPGGAADTAVPAAFVTLSWHEPLKVR